MVCTFAPNVFSNIFSSQIEAKTKKAVDDTRSKRYFLTHERRDSMCLSETNNRAKRYNSP